MNTLRVCATMGLGLSLAVASGCKSDSTTTKKDAAPVDTRRADGPAANRDTAPAVTCFLNGTVYTVNQTFVSNCVTWMCMNTGNVQQTSGAPCSDAGPDTPVNRDVLAPGDTARPVDSSGTEGGGAIDGPTNRDTQPSEAGSVRLDVGGRDTAGPEVSIPLDTAAPVDLAEPEDTAIVTPDVAVVADTAPATVCIYGGLGYVPGGGVSFDCFSCKKCECASTAGGPLIVVTADNCTAVDAQ
jgi:hypothetical protein